MSDSLTHARSAWYALPSVALAAIALPFYIVVPGFYADQLGISLASIGSVLLGIRLFDAVTDPLLGWWSDRVRSPWGRRRFVFVLSIPLTAVSAFMLLWPPADAGVWHLALWGAALSLGTTCSLLPYTAWGAELASGYHERVRLSAWREGASLLGTLVAIILPFAGGIDTPHGWHGLAWLAVFVALVLPVTGLLAVWRVPEPVDLSSRRLPAAQAWHYLRANRPFVRLAVAFLLNSLANAVPASLFIYYVGHQLQAPALQGPLLLAYFVSAIAGLPLAVWVARRMGKHRAWCAAMLLACAIFALTGCLGPGDTVAFAVVCVATGVLLGFDLSLPAAIQADVIDHDTVQSGEQRSGLYFAAWSFVSKLALALSAGLVFPLLDAAGFAGHLPPGSQSDGALTVLVGLYALLPIVPKLAAIALMWNFGLDEAAHQRLRAQLAAKP